MPSSMSVGIEAVRIDDDATRPRGIDSSMRAGPVHWRARARARARIGGDFSRHFYSAVSPSLCPTLALRVTCALRALLDRFPAIVLASRPSRSRARHVLLRGRPPRIL